MNPSAADIIPRAVARFSQNFHGLARFHREIYKSTHGRVERGDRELQDMLEQLVALLGFIDWGRLRELTGSTEQLADVVLASYRRLERLFEYQQQKKATIL